MTRTQLIGRLVRQTQIPRKTTGALLNELVKTAFEQAVSQGEFVIPGLGTLRKVRPKAGRARASNAGMARRFRGKTMLTFSVSRKSKLAVTGGRPSSDLEDRVLKSLAEIFSYL